MTRPLLLRLSACSGRAGRGRGVVAEPGRQVWVAKLGVEGKSTLQAQSWWFWAPYAAQGQVPSSFQFKLESSLDPRLPSPPTDSSTDHQPLLGLRSSSDTKLLRSQIPSWTPRFFYSISNSSAVTSSPRLPTPAFASSSDRFSTSRLLLGWSPQTSDPFLDPRHFSDPRFKHNPF